MAKITGELEGFTYVVDWLRIGPDEIHCTANITDPQGIAYGHQQIRLRGDVYLDEHADSAALLWVEGLISEKPDDA